MSTSSQESQTFLEDVLEGLSHNRKHPSSKYLYDARGSRLFEEICELEAYYPTRTELAIMEAHADEMADAVGGRVRLVEPGAGSGKKTELLLAALDEVAAYIPVDISQTALDICVDRLSKALPDLDMLPVCADFTAPLELPEPNESYDRTAVYYPGSTLGNFPPENARSFLERMRDMAGDGGAAIIGVDLEKDVDVLERAYNDEEGVTAAFNLNVLRRINRELGADFDLDQFRHRAVWDDEKGCIEMRLYSQCEQTVDIADRTFSFDEGEYIVTEYSYKFQPEGFEAMAEGAGFAVKRYWTDDRDWFGVWYLEA